MVDNRFRKMKLGRAAANAAAAKAESAALERNRELSIRYEGGVESNPSNYVLLSIGGGGGWGGE